MSALSDEAMAIIHELALYELLAPYGTARLVGSVALDLIVKRDIDLHLLVATPNLYALIDPIYHTLLDDPDIREVRISDYRREGGLKIGIDAYPGPTGPWEIDLWVTDRVEDTGFALVEWLACELTPEYRAVIMAIKQALHQQGRLRDGISKRVYLAVLEAGVRSVQEFTQWEQQSKG